MRKRTYRKKGFTLVEVLVALAVFGVVMVAIFPVFNSSIERVRRANRLVSGNIEASCGAITGSDVWEKVNVDNQLINYIYRPITSGGGSNAAFNWLVNPGEVSQVGDIQSSIFMVKSETSGVFYYYYVPYHPYRCPTTCDKCEIYQQFKPNSPSGDITESEGA